MKHRKPTLLHMKGSWIGLERVRHARTFFSRFKGLLGESPERFNYALVFHLEKKSMLGASIHMLFMAMPIDVVWLDEEWNIVDWVEHATPWTLNYTPREAAQYIVELPAGTISTFKIKKGQKMKW